MFYDIGVFDSGLGGLTVYKELKAALPKEKFAYLSDSKRCPYGIKSTDSIIEICKSNLSFFQNLKVKKVLIACHTASTVAYEYLKNFTDIEIIPIHITTGNFLLNLPHKSSLLILGTDSTIRNGYYQNLIKKFRTDLTVKAKACPLLVEYIQNQIQDHIILNDILNLYNICYEETDYILLACTHFPIITDFIKKRITGKTNIINPAFLLANQLKTSNEKSSKMMFEDDFFVNGSTEEFDRFLSNYLKKTIHSKRVVLENSVKI